VKLNKVIPPVQFDKESSEDDEFSDDLIEAKQETTKEDHWGCGGPKISLFRCRLLNC